MSNGHVTNHDKGLPPQSVNRAVVSLLVRLVLIIVGILAIAALLIAILFLLWSWHALKSGTLAD